jgi:calcineurin-like phosphoesterase family protein
MPSTFIVSDTHFGHANICKFLNADGTKLRPWDSPEEMDEYMVKAWNEVVRPKDKVYHLGDVVINRRCLPTVGRLNGDKVLIKGNHDILRIHEYLEYFRDVRACHVMDNMLLSHIPVHPGSKGRFRANVHGHTHSNVVLHEDGTPDPWYIPVSVEHTDFRPIPFENIRKIADELR